MFGESFLWICMFLTSKRTLHLSIIVKGGIFVFIKSTACVTFLGMFLVETSFEYRDTFAKLRMNQGYARGLKFLNTYIF